MNAFIRPLIFAISALCALAYHHHAHAGTGDLSAFLGLHCAILTPERQVYCWGGADSTRLGNASYPDPALRKVRGMPAGASMVATGGHGACAIQGGALYCWGHNTRGLLGTFPGSSDAAIQIAGMGSGVSRVAMGETHVCAIKDGDLYCWGGNVYGQLGIGVESFSTRSPQRVLNGGVTDVAAGQFHTCAVQSGNLLCWGANTFGQLGVGSGVGTSSTPLLVLSGSVWKVVAGLGRTCALQADRLWCWGDNRAYGVAYPDHTATFVYTPHLVMQSDDIIDITLGVGSQIGCVRRGVEWHCWGSNVHGERGDDISDGRTMAYSTPTHVAFLDGVAHLAHGWTSGAAIRSDGCPHAWGRNSGGALGRLPYTSALHLPQHVLHGCLAPVHFGKLSPPHGTSGLGRIAQLSWQPFNGEGAIGYRYVVNTSYGNVISGWVTTTGAQIAGLEAGRTYTWQVYACAEPDCTIYRVANQGTTFSFSTADFPAAFSKSEPADGGVRDSTAPRLAWNASSGAQRYLYCYALVDEPPCTPSIPTNETSVTLAGLTNGAQYRWQVRACADAACQVWTDANAGLHWTFRVALRSAPFGKLAPANMLVDVPTQTLVLRWGSSAGASHYRYCLTTATSCTPATGVGAATAVTVTNLMPGQAYYWQVYACSDQGCVVFRAADSGGWVFRTIPEAPGTFQKIAPENGSSGHGRAVALQWQMAARAVRYRYCIWPAQLPSCVGAYQDVGTALSATVSNLLPGQTYRWQVLACANDSCTAQREADGGAWSFTVASLPGVDHLSPPNNATGQPREVRLTWQARNGPIHHYRYCVALGPDCEPTQSLNASFVDISALQTGSRYAWRVRACADADCTIHADAPNAPWFFTVASPPSAFYKQAPANGQLGVAASPALSWTHAGGAHHYRYCLGVALGCPLGEASMSNSPGLVVGPLSPGAMYFWQVRACADAGCTVWRDADEGAYHRFTVAALPAPFSKTLPAHQAVVSLSAAVGFTWTAQAGVHHYRFCIAPHDQPSCTPLFPFVSPSLQRGMAYRWQVRACADAGCTVWRDADEGAHHSFLVASAPFGKSWPYDLSAHDEVTLTLRWRESEGAAAYRYCVVGTPEACESAWVSAGGALSATVGGLARGQTYHWQVQACADAACREPVAADDGRMWRFSVRTPGEVISTHRALSMTLVGGSRFGWPTRYLVEVRNPLSERVALTLTVGVPAMSELELAERAHEDGQMMTRVPEWSTVLYPGGRAAYTVTLRHRPETPSQLLTGRVVTPLVALGDGTAQATTTHPVEPNRIYLPALKLCRPQPDAYEVDNGTQPVELQPNVRILRNLHDRDDIDYLRVRMRFIGVQTHTVSLSFDVLPTGTEIRVSGSDGRQTAYVTTEEDARRGYITIRAFRDKGNAAQEYVMLVSLQRPRTGDGQCAVGYQAEYTPPSGEMRQFATSETYPAEDRDIEITID